VSAKPTCLGAPPYGRNARIRRLWVVVRHSHHDCALDSPIAAFSRLPRFRRLSIGSIGGPTGPTLDSRCHAAGGRKGRMRCRLHQDRARRPGRSETRSVPSYGREPEHGVCCEIDHLIPLELGGSNAPENLWPQRYDGERNAARKDRLERRLHAMVCRGEISL
jgi:hypothetical protein